MAIRNSPSPILLIPCLTLLVVDIRRRRADARRSGPRVGATPSARSRVSARVRRTGRSGGGFACAARSIGFAIGVSWVSPLAASADLALEFYTSAPAFAARVGGVRVVDFDDVETPADPNAFIPFASDRYLASHGVSITGTEGQYASQGFGYPGDYPPVSSPNVYAPGPTATFGAPPGSGGHDTEVTFRAEGTDAVVSGFGVWFIDADFPGVGASSFTIYDAVGGEIGTTGTVSGPNASQLFVGVVAVDTGSHQPTPAIARVHIVNGSGWPDVDANEGVVLDDLTFPAPVPVVEPDAWPLAAAAALWLRARRDSIASVERRRLRVSWRGRN